MSKLRHAKTYPMDKQQAYTVAHTAKCKLSFAANDPERNLRFLLGHSFTLDNALLRVVEIENQSAKDDIAVESNKKEKTEGQSGSLAGRRVSFVDNEARPSALGTGAGEKATKPRDKSPPPADLSGEDDLVDEDDGLGLTRFGSAAAEPPRMIPSSEEDSDEDDDGPVSPPTLPADFDYHALMEGPEDTELGELYESVRSCPCHGKQDVKSKALWDVKTPDSADNNQTGKRLAVMRVDA